MGSLKNGEDVEEVQAKNPKGWYLGTLGYTVGGHLHTLNPS
jgi:hypothetical protein